MTQNENGLADEGIIPASWLTPANWLTPAEVSSVLRVSRMTVYRLIRDGSLTAIRVGRSYRIPAHALRHILEYHD